MARLANLGGIVIAISCAGGNNAAGFSTTCEQVVERLSPLSDVHAVGTDQLCAVDLARLSKAVPVDQFRYRVVEIGAGQRLELAATLAPDGLVCVRPKSLARSELADNASERRMIFEVRNGTAVGPLEIHTCDLGPRGMFVVGLNRRAQ